MPLNFLSEFNNIRENLRKPCPIWHKRVIAAHAAMRMSPLWKHWNDWVLKINFRTEEEVLVNVTATLLYSSSSGHRSIWTTCEFLHQNIVSYWHTCKHQTMQKITTESQTIFISRQVQSGNQCMTMTAHTNGLKEYITLQKGQGILDWQSTMIIAK